MSRSHSRGNSKAVLIPKGKPEFHNAKDAVMSRQVFGHTHRIRQRNKQLWCRLLARQRRAWDQRVIKEQDS